MDTNACQSWKTVAIVLAVVLPLFIVALVFYAWRDYQQSRGLQRRLGWLEGHLAHDGAMPPV